MPGKSIPEKTPKSQEKKKCAIVGCNGKMHGNIYCTKHYQRNKHHGDPLYGEKEKRLQCIVDGCTGIPRSTYSPYCEKHYGRIRRNGDLDLRVDKKHYDNCVYCGAKTKGAKYCDIRCYTRNKRGNPVTRTCITCGDEYLPNNKGIDHLTCSKECEEIRVKKRTEIYANAHVNYSTYADQISYAEYVEEDEDGGLICKCTYCGKKFYPTNRDISSRIAALNGIMKGELRLYCSSRCKKECPTYRQQIQYKGKIYGAAREVPSDFRHIALADRGYTCEKCGSKENGLHVHHIEGYTEQPMFSSDLNNVLVVCKKCHRLIHKQPGCTYYDYQCDNRKTTKEG